MSKRNPVDGRFMAPPSEPERIIKVLINQDLDAVGRTGETELTAFTDGCLGLRNILAAAGVTTAAFLDWFHIGMRLRHLRRIAGGLSCDNPSREAAKAVIIELSACTGSCGMAKPPTRGSALIGSTRSCTISRVRPVHESPLRRRESCGPRCTRWILPDRPERLARQLRRATSGRIRLAPRSPKGRSISLVNRRMNKSQQMRWSRRGADLLDFRFVALSIMALSVPTLDRRSDQPTIRAHR